MSAILVDTSVWIEFFRGGDFPHVEDALQEGRVFLSPIVAAELASGKLSPAKHEALIEFLRDLPMVDCDLSHWCRVGELRGTAARKGLSISTPDAHVAQSAIDLKATLVSGDDVFRRLAKGVCPTLIVSA